MRVSDYREGGHDAHTWPILLRALHAAPFAAARPRLQEELRDLLARELARDPQQAGLRAESELLDIAEGTLAASLPWYGGDVVRFTNGALTGWRPEASFLVDEQDRVGRSVEAILDATAAIPSHLGTLEQTFAAVRARLDSGEPPVVEVEAVLDAVERITGCRAGWPRVLCAAMCWMHEACGVPMRAQRRAAMADWLEQVCAGAVPPSVVARAEILSAMTRSLAQSARW